LYDVESIGKPLGFMTGLVRLQKMSTLYTPFSDDSSNGQVYQRNVLNNVEQTQRWGCLHSMMKDLLNPFNKMQISLYNPSTVMCDLLFHADTKG